MRNNRSKMKNGIRLHMVRFVLVLMVTILLVNISVNSIHADPPLYISMTPVGDNDIYSGDLFVVNVYASSFRGFESFEGVTLNYDKNVLSFESITASPELDSFAYEFYETDDGVCVSGVDSRFQESTDAEVTPYYSETNTILFSIGFIINPSASGFIEINLLDDAVFKSTSRDENVYSQALYDWYQYNLSSTESNDSSLMSLSVIDNNYSPVFSSNVLEYSCYVGRAVEEIEIYAFPSNANASIIISGTSNLSYGENIVTIDITAEDGVTKSTYTIHVFRQESYMAEGAGFVSNDGTEYMFLSLPTQEVPPGFNEATRIINGYVASVYAREGMSSYLIYLYNEVDDPMLYFYNPVTGSVFPYEENNFFVKNSSIMRMIDVPDSVTIPNDFSAKEVEIEGMSVEAFVDRRGDIILYMEDETGYQGFFRYDPETKRYYDYDVDQINPFKTYRLFFDIFMLISVIEAIAIIITIFSVRKIMRDKISPKPRRV